MTMGQQRSAAKIVPYGNPGAVFVMRPPVDAPGESAAKSENQ